MQSGLAGIYTWGIGVVIPFCLLSFLFVVRALGAGDIKTFMVIGGFFGTSYVLSCIFISFIICSIYSIVLLFLRKQFLERICYFFQYILLFQQTKQITPYYVAERDGTNCIIHFSYGILVSAVLLWQFPNLIL